MSARLRPCNARACRVSEPRETMTCFLASSKLAETSGRRSQESLPSGPSTVICLPARAILTPAGTVTGCLPIRDIASSTFASSTFGVELPEFAEHFAAEIALPRFAVADHATAGADNRDSQTVEHG